MLPARAHTIDRASCPSQPLLAVEPHPSLPASYPDVESLTFRTTSPLPPIRTSTPTRYLKRTGIIPRHKTLKSDAVHRPTILSSSSSASSVNSSSPASPTTYMHRLVDQRLDSLPALTEFNLAQLMSRLSCSAPVPSSFYLDPSGSHPQPEAQLEEISRFSSDDSSAHSDSSSDL